MNDINPDFLERVRFCITRRFNVMDPSRCGTEPEKQRRRRTERLIDYRN